MASALVGIFLVTACSSDEIARHCLGSEGAEVCAEVVGGSIAIEATGLQPGSELVLSGDSIPEARHEVGHDGSPEGRIGFLSVSPEDPLVIEVRAVAADGADIDGQLSVGA